MVATVRAARWTIQTDSQARTGSLAADPMTGGGKAAGAYIISPVSSHKIALLSLAALLTLRKASGCDFLRLS
jgi:hypothetical protein